MSSLLVHARVSLASQVGHKTVRHAQSLVLDEVHNLTPNTIYEKRSALFLLL